MKYTEEELESIIDRINGFLDDYKKADDEFQTNQRRENWKNKFGERFAPYSDKLKILNGDDFDVIESSREEYEEKYSDLTDDEYCDALENNIKATIQRVWPEAPAEKVEEVAEEVTKDVAEGATEEPTEEASEAEEEPMKEEVHIEAEDKDGDGEIQKDEIETHTVEESEKPSEEEKDEVADFYKELEDYKAKMPKRG